MKNYTDYQRQQIAEEEYNSRLKFGQPVTIDEGKTTIGYVAEVEQSGSGFKAYVITDIKLPKNPTQAQLDQVGQVTMLYEGSTASGDTPQKALDTVLDWGINDIPMAVRVMVPDLLPTRGTVQLRKAADFTNQSMEKYRNAYFDFYGHSLGSMNVQYGITSVDTEHLYRISGAYIYNGPNTYRVLSQEQRDNEALLHDRIYNYVDPLDMVGIGYHPGEGAVGQVFRINTVKSSKSGLEALIDQHMFGGYTYDEYGNMIDKDGFFVHQDAIVPLDINGDGKHDIMLNAASTTPRNLFLSSGRISAIGAKDIKLDPDSLRNLSSNLQMLSLVEIASLIKLCQLCQEKNNNIKEDFETRKQKVEESIVQRFKETRLTEVFYQLHDSVGQLLAKKQIFQTLMTPGQVVDTISDPAYFSTGAPLILETYNTQLGRLGQYSSTLYQHATEEKTSGFQNGVPINPTPTALKSSMVLEESAKHLKERSETIFEGKGLREGKKDGISLALDEVLSVEQKNLLELQKALSSVSQLTLSLANHFQTMDDWLHDQLSNGGNLEGMMVANVPPSYKAYLEASHIFDDVKDVLQAFDHQVEENSKRYGKEVAETFTQAFSSLQTALDRWSSELTSFNQTISSIQATFTTGIYVDKTSFVDKKPVVTRTYWGQLWRLYPSTTYSTVNTAKNTITPLADKVISALEVTRTASHDMQNLKPQLKKIIEEGVYKAFDLDEIVASQKAIQSITDRILRELTYVITTISSQMQGEAVTTLTQQLEKVKSLTSYFNNLVGDCFGDQSKAQGAASTGSVSLEARTFSLNK